MQYNPRQIDVDAAVRLARAAADEMLAASADPTADLTPAERRELVTIAVAVDAKVVRWAGLPASGGSKNESEPQ